MTIQDIALTLVSIQHDFRGGYSFSCCYVEIRIVVQTVTYKGAVSWSSEAVKSSEIWSKQW